MKKFLFCLLILAIATFEVLGFTASAFATANPEEVFVFVDGAWRVKSGDQLKDFDGITGTAEHDGGTVQWCFVDPDSLDEAKGMKPSVVLYSESGKNTAHLLLDEEASKPSEVSLSPYAASYLVGLKSEEGRSQALLSLYDTEYDESGYVSRKSFMIDADASAFFWTNVAGVTAMAFTMPDENGWRSAAVFYPPYGVRRVNDGIIVLKKGSENEQYEVISVSDDGGELTIAAIKGHERSEIKVKVPPIPEETNPEDL